MARTLSTSIVAVLVVCAACKSRRSERDEPAPNPMKTVVGGEGGPRPQMGTFAVTPEQANAIGAALQHNSKAAYELALTKATKAWAGDRTFCEDAVRLTVGYLGGRLEPEERAKWQKATLAEVEQEQFAAIMKLYAEMIRETDPAPCKKSLAMKVEALKFAAEHDLELMEFGY